jgi:flagellar protein FliJ
MRRFHFPMQQLLKLKIYHEKEWEIKLGELTGRMEEIRRRIEECGSRRLEGFALRAASVRDFNALAAADNYVLRMEQQTERLRRDLNTLAKEREKIQSRYLEASKERKVFDRLREKQEAAFYKEEERAQVMLQDDMNSSAAARRIEYPDKPARAGGVES